MTNTPDILKQIVAVKRREVERLKVERPVPALEALIEEQAPPLNLGGALWGDSVRIIAEIKRASPAKGPLRPDMDVVELASSYVDTGPPRFRSSRTSTTSREASRTWRRSIAWPRATPCPC